MMDRALGHAKLRCDGVESGCALIGRSIDGS